MWSLQILVQFIIRRPLHCEDRVPLRLILASSVHLVLIVKECVKVILYTPQNQKKNCHNFFGHFGHNFYTLHTSTLASALNNHPKPISTQIYHRSLSVRVFVMVVQIRLREERRGGVWSRFAKDGEGYPWDQED